MIEWSISGVSETRADVRRALVARRQRTRDRPLTVDRAGQQRRQVRVAPEPEQTTGSGSIVELGGGKEPTRRQGADRGVGRPADPGCAGPVFLSSPATRRLDLRRPHVRARYPVPGGPTRSRAGLRCSGGGSQAVERRGGHGPLGEQRQDLRFPEPAVPAGGADGPDPPVGRPPGHRFGIHPEHLRDLVRGEQRVRCSRWSRFPPRRGPPGVVHNGHVRPYCTPAGPHPKSPPRGGDHLRRAGTHPRSSLRIAACRSHHPGLRRSVDRSTRPAPARAEACRHRNPCGGARVPTPPTIGGDCSLSPQKPGDSPPFGWA